MVAGYVKPYLLIEQDNKKIRIHKEAIEAWFYHEKTKMLLLWLKSGKALEFEEASSLYGILENYIR